MQRDFKGIWIPKEIWFDTRLNALEKIILAEIDSLDMSEKGCYAGNKHLADFCQCSETKISIAVSKLIELEYIYVEKFDGRTRILKSRLANFERQNLKKCKAEFKNLKQSNINNNTNNNTYKDIIAYLNEKAQTNYRASSKDTQRYINARLNDGYNIDDFKIVIDKMCKEWQGTEFEQYLRPSTLFGTKFESYLNRKTTKKQVFETSSFDLGKAKNKINNFD